MDAEHRYLRTLIRAYCADQPTAPELPSEVQTASVAGLLDRHHVLGTFGHLCPAECRELVAPILHRARLRNTILLLELTHVVTLLEAQGYEPLVLKGAALAQTTYPEVTGRFFLDLDVLVDTEHIEPAVALLQQRGFEATGGRHREFYTHHHFHHILSNRSGVVLELHWDLTRQSDYVCFDISAMRRRSRVVDLSGVTMRIPGDTDQLLHAAAQGTREGFTDLRRIIDAALLLRNGADRMPGLADLARRQGLATGLWVLLRLVSEFAGIDAAPELEEELRPRVIARTCLTRLDLAQKLLDRTGRRHSGFVHLIRWLCAPSATSVVREMFRYVVPDRGQLLDMGYHPGELPGPLRRVKLMLRRTLSMIKVIAYQGWHLVARV